MRRYLSSNTLKATKDYWYSWKRSSAIQQGLLNIGIFLLSLLLLSILTYFSMLEEMSSRLDKSLNSQMQTLIQQASDDDWEDEYEDDDDDDDYKNRYKQLQQALHTDGNFFLILPKSALQQSAHKAYRETGPNTVPAKALGRHDSKHKVYRILVKHHDNRVFVVGEDNDSDHDIFEIVMRSFLLNGLIALLLTVALVIYLSNRSRQQIKRIEHVLQHAAKGELNQRIGTPTKNNDLAHVSQHIDQMLSRLETSMAAMTDISANIAHELKTPISRLRHDLTQALDQQEQGENSEQALQAAYDESTYITQTFDALLRIAQIEGGARRAHFALIDFTSIIATVLDIYTDVAEDAGMQLSYHPTDAHQTLPLEGDKELLIQMLANLIENAIRYCPQGTHIRLESRIVHTPQQKMLQLTVADNGEGIPLEERQKVFQRLYRVNKSRSDKRGTGLGLSLVKAIIDLHDANISLDDNEPGLKVVITMSQL